MAICCNTIVVSVDASVGSQPAVLVQQLLSSPCPSHETAIFFLSFCRWLLPCRESNQSRSSNCCVDKIHSYFILGCMLPLNCFKVATVQQLNLHHENCFCLSLHLFFSLIYRLMKLLMARSIKNPRFSFVTPTNSRCCKSIFWLMLQHCLSPKTV